MKRRNFIKNTGLTIAGMAINNHIYSKNSSAKKSLNIIILMSGGVQYHDIIDNDKVDFNVLFQNHIPMLVNCNTQLKYTGEILEHAPAVLSVLRGIKGNNERKLFFGNINSETTLAVKNSDLSLEIIATTSSNSENNYRNDAAVFEKVYQYLTLEENTTLILNLEDTDMAHCSKEKYFEILNFYNLQINELCKAIYNRPIINSYNSKLLVASVLGRNSFDNEILNSNNVGGSDHYHQSARDLFSFTVGFAQKSLVNMQHDYIESKDLLKQFIHLSI